MCDLACCGKRFVKYCRKPLEDLKLASDDMSSFAREIRSSLYTNNSRRSTKSVELEKSISIRTVKWEE